MEPFAAIFQNALNFKLTTVSIREVMLLEFAPCDIFVSDGGPYRIFFYQGNTISSDAIKELLHSGSTLLFVREESYQNIIALLQESLSKVTRALSIGNPLENAKKQMNLLTICLGHLYDSPTDDQKLNLVFQSIKNLVSFLSKNPKLHFEIYRDYQSQKHHFIFAQPMLSSIFLLGILQQSRLLSPKEIESLFLTSYFKDLGMSAIPIEKYNSPVLSKVDKKLFSKHPEISVDLLSGRVQLAPSYLKIIENHHSFSLLGTGDFNPEETFDNFIGGFETMIVSTSDIIAAMISERPYRSATSLYDALELIRVLIAESYPTEFKYIVHYFRQFFK
ncbi:MAG: hypothetical protein KAG61_07170 [Bacteriovoracaceae bacterium]|nr:hypothetical protein [Bacteriovoracaceae bacterium]